MTVHQTWDTSLSGIDPFTHSRSVLLVPSESAVTDHPALEELRRWGWEITVADPTAGVAALAALARRHDVALFADIRGTSALRRALTAHLPTVAMVPLRRRGRIRTLMHEAGVGRGTTVLIIRDPRDAKLLRRLCGAALVRASVLTSARDRASALGTVLLRAHAWQLSPRPTDGEAAR